MDRNRIWEGSGMISNSREARPKNGSAAGLDSDEIMAIQKQMMGAMGCKVMGTVPSSLGFDFFVSDAFGSLASLRPRL